MTASSVEKNAIKGSSKAKCAEFKIAQATFASSVERPLRTHFFTIKRVKSTMEFLLSLSSFLLVVGFNVVVVVADFAGVVVGEIVTSF